MLIDWAPTDQPPAPRLVELARALLERGGRLMLESRTALPDMLAPWAAPARHWTAPAIAGPHRAALAAQLRAEVLHDTPIVLVFGLPGRRACAAAWAPLPWPQQRATIAVLDRWPATLCPDTVNFLASAAGLVVLDDRAGGESRWQGIALLHFAPGDTPCALQAFAARCAAARRVARPILPDDHADGARAQLALVTPLPPQATGVADYAARMIPALAHHYAITLVCEAPPAPELAACTAQWLPPHVFARVAHGFDRVVYQIGNSPFHRAAIDQLLPECPGVVVLHDASLADARWASAEAAPDPDAARHALIAAHEGFGAQLVAQREGLGTAFARHALLGPAIDHALGVIVHSHHAAARIAPRRMAEVIAHPAIASPPADRKAARAALGIADDAFVTCSFGEIGPRKSPLTVLEGWLAAPRGHAPHDRLVFVGHPHEALDTALAARAAAAGCAGQVCVTGRVAPASWRHWLAAADCAVQLRRHSIGESSGAVADCLGAGLPLIVNCHGAMAELPAAAVVMLDEDPDPAAIGAAIARLRDDPAARAALCAAALHHVAHDLAPAAIAQQWHAAIERAYATGPLAPVWRLVRRAARLDPPLPPSARAALAEAIAATWPAGAGLTLYAILPDDADTDSRWRMLLSAGHADVRLVPAMVCGSALRDASAQAAALFGFAASPAGDPAPPAPGDAVITARGVALPPAWHRVGVRHWCIDDPTLEPLFAEAP